jgi:hypothetical protein
VADSPWPAQSADLDLTTNAKGELILQIFSFRNPITIEPSLLRFSWDKNAPANVRLADVREIDHYEPPGTEEHTYQFVAAVRFQAWPSKIGIHALHLLPLTNFVRTAAGPIEAKGISIWMWRPDDLGADRGLRAMQKYVGRTIYAYGGARVGCADRDAVYDWHSGLRVVSVKRESTRIDHVVTGTTLSELPGASRAFTFFAIHPVKLALKPIPGTIPLGQNGVSSDREIPCIPGMRFADPWHAAVTITTSIPPARIDKIHIGSTRSEVLWLSGYPDAFGTAEQFEQMNRWDYHQSPPFSWYVRFRHDRVIRYQPPGQLP